MPEGIGKIEHKIYKRMPAPVQRFWDRFHKTIKQAVFVAVFVAIAVIGLEVKNANETANKAKSEVRVIKQSANCKPDENGNPVRPRKCAESISTGFRTLNPTEACEFLQKGAKVIYIGGKPIPPVTCKSPAKPQEKSSNGRIGATGAGDASSPTSSPAGSPEAQTPGASPQQQGSGGQPSSPNGSSPKHPSKGQEGSEGSTPEGGGGSSPAGSPGSNGGDQGGGAIVTNPPGSEGGGSTGGGDAGSSKGGLEEIVNGAGKTVEEATKPLCEPGLLGVQVCIPR